MPYKEKQDHNKACKRYYEKNKDAVKLRSLKQRRRAKIDVLNAYGNECSWCGYSDPRALQIDHVNNDGAEQRRNGAGHGWGLYVQLRKAGYPEGYQTLCANCNQIKHWEHANGPID